MLNVVSSTIIEKFGLTVVDHPLPRKIFWIDNATCEIMHKCLVPIDFYIYKANIWCDVIPMNVGRIFLGIPWLDNNNVIYDDQANAYQFRYEGKNIKLIPSPPKPKAKPIEQKP